MVRRRPKNRRSQIAETAAAAFAELGYHGVSMDTIAARLDVSSAALYRHYPSKHALFAEELLRLGAATVAAATLPPAAATWSPRRRLDLAIEGIVSGTITNRPTVALTRWETRYLAEPERLTLEGCFATAITLLSGLIGDVRPDLPERELRVRAVGMFSAVSSIGDHRAVLAVKSMKALLKSMCWAMADIDLPVPGADDPPTVPVPIRAGLKHELLLQRAIHLFYERGYPNVTVEDIAVAADLPAASAVYRYFRGKSDLLTAAFRRVSDRMSVAIGAAIAETTCPAEALATLVRVYARGAFADRELAYVYYADFGHLPPEELVPLTTVHRLVVDEWARLLIAVRPELTAAEAQVLVHVALGLVVDYGRVFGDDERACPHGWVIELMLTALFGHAGPVSYRP
ncbi:TetR/AcrR family transcriptional regulator [Nocardia sp. NPDC003693]